MRSVTGRSLSPPVRGRGLKQVVRDLGSQAFESPPVRGRGLKLCDLGEPLPAGQVAPRAGARIETTGPEVQRVWSPPVHWKPGRPPCGGAD